MGNTENRTPLGEPYEKRGVLIGMGFAVPADRQAVDLILTRSVSEGCLAKTLVILSLTGVSVCENRLNRQPDRSRGTGFLSADSFRIRKMLRETENLMAESPKAFGLERHPNRPAGGHRLPALQAITAPQSGRTKLTAVATCPLKYRRANLTTPIASSSGNSLCFRQWAQIACGIRQRMEAISACLDDVFQRRAIPDLFLGNRSLCKMLQNLVGQIGEVSRSSISWGWLASTDLYVGSDGQITVIDQNLSVPTGMELLTRLIDRSRTISKSAVNDLNRWLADSVAKSGLATPDSTAVVLDPCRYNPTIRENEFLARTVNSTLAQAGELVVRNGVVELVTGLKRIRVHTVVRRVDDDLLDPNCFRPDSLIGVPGLCKAWRNGAVNVVNPPGSCVANVRSFTQLVPAMIREYLIEEPELEIAVSEECSSDTAIQRLTKNPSQFAVRTNDPMRSARPFFGNTATASETSSMFASVRREPEKFVMRSALPDADQGGFNLRVFSSMGKGFIMPVCGIGSSCQADGGATLAINEDASARFVG